MSLLTMPKPDEVILARRDEIIRQLRKLVPNAVLITDSEGRRTFETDALTAYRCMPLAVVLPQSTEEASVILRYCHEHKIKVVPRGAGTSLSGGALPLEDVDRARRHAHDAGAGDRRGEPCVRVEAGITNLAITNAVGGARLSSMRQTRRASLPAPLAATSPRTRAARIA